MCLADSVGCKAIAKAVDRSASEAAAKQTNVALHEQLLGKEMLELFS